MGRAGTHAFTLRPVRPREVQAVRWLIMTVRGFSERRRRHGDLEFVVQHFETPVPRVRSGERRRSA